MPRGGKTGGKLASSRSGSAYQRSSSVASSSKSQEVSGTVASVLAELQSLLVQTQVGGLYLECILFTNFFHIRKREIVAIKHLLIFQRPMKR